MKKTALLTLCMAVALHINAQSRFSQFYAVPSLVNPASTGRFNKSYRAGAAFRRELNNRNFIFTQSHFFADIKILGAALPEGETLAVGISGLNEQSKSEGITNNYFSASLAYHKNLDEEGRQILGIGFKGTLAQNRLESPTIVFEDMLISWASAGYTDINPFLFQNTQVSYASIDVGLFYQGSMNAANSFSTGISIQHINNPEKTFSGGQLRILPDYLGHVAWESKFANSNKIYASALTRFMGKSFRELTAGISCEISLKKSTEISIGTWLKKNSLFGNSIMPSVGLNFKDFVLTSSYDVGVSPRQRYIRSASEFTLIYTHATSRKSFVENRFIRF